MIASIISEDMGCLPHIGFFQLPDWQRPAGGVEFLEQFHPGHPRQELAGDSTSPWLTAQ
jgi:hypothetical protein